LARRETELRRRTWLERGVFWSGAESPEVGDATAADAEYRGADGAAASDSLATAEFDVSSQWRVEPTQYPHAHASRWPTCESRTSSHDLRATCANIGSREITRNSGSQFVVESAARMHALHRWNEAARAADDTSEQRRQLTRASSARARSALPSLTRTREVSRRAHEERDADRHSSESSKRQ
jgi:hypothetical protein